MVTYLGEVVLLDHYLVDAPWERVVVRFVLGPVATLHPGLPTMSFTRAHQPRLEMVPAITPPEGVVDDRPRRRTPVVTRYQRYLLGLGHEVGRLRVIPAGELDPLDSDLWDRTTGEVIQASTTVCRQGLRRVVGELMDVGRFVPAARLAALLPDRPRPDLRGYLGHAGVDVVYPDGDRWRRVAPRDLAPPSPHEHHRPRPGSG